MHGIGIPRKRGEFRVSEGNRQFILTFDVSTLSADLSRRPSFRIARRFGFAIRNSVILGFAIRKIKVMSRQEQALILRTGLQILFYTASDCKSDATKDEDEVPRS